MNDKKAAKKIIRIAKTRPDLYSKADVVYARIIKKKIIDPIPIPNLIKVFLSKAANFSFKSSIVKFLRSIMHSPIYKLLKIPSWRYLYLKY